MPVIGTRIDVEGQRTPGGRPLPVTGEVLATQTVIERAPGGRTYPDVCIPAQEELAADEMRMICLGSGNPYVRRAQAATGWLVQLGNGDNFIFDVGGGTVQNLWSLEIPSAVLDKLFLTHLHLDHVGDFHVLYDAMVWGRNTALNVWGPSGSAPEFGTAHFCASMEAAAGWHNRSKTGLGPSGGMTINANEFDYGAFSPDNPRQLVYDQNDVKIHAFPVAHLLEGAVAYRLEWNGRSMTFHGDGEPATFEAEQAAGVEVFMHEVFLDPHTMADKNDLPFPVAKNISDHHTTPDRLGKLYDIAQPTLAVAYHYHLDDDTVDPFFDLVADEYDGPVALAQDLMVINVTPEQIVLRQAQTDLLHQTPKNPRKEEAELDPLPDGRCPEWVQSTVIAPK